MRSAVMILALLLVLGSVFTFVVLRGRDATGVRGGPTTAATGPTSRRTVPVSLVPPEAEANVIGPSQGVAVQSLNARGQLASEFNVDRLEPRKDGAVDVYGPVAKFYGNSGGLVTITGATGTVAYSQSGGRGDPNAVGSATPTSGTLRDVTISMYDAVGDAEPSLVATVPAVRFDALDNRVATVDDVIDGRGTLAENVPVAVRGRDYEFDGFGLVMRWNDRDSRLEQLEIHRGERLLVKDVSKFTGDASDARDAGPTTRAARPAPATRRAEPSPQPRDNAERRTGTTRPAAATPAAKPPASDATRSGRQELYRATFDRDVRVTRSGVEVARADAMNVVLPLDSKRRADAATTKPTAATPAEPRPRREPTATRRTEATPRRAPTAPAATPATRPAEPVEIRWTGKLTVRPLEPDPARPAAAGTMIEFVGAPARLAQEGASVEGRLIHVEPDSGRARIEPGGPVKTINLTGADGGQLRSRSPLTIDRTAGLATINGGGALTAPPKAADKSAAATSVTWSRRLELRFGGAAGEIRDAKPWLSEATIEGDARIESDAFNMTGDALVFGFDAPADAARPATAAEASAVLPAPEAQQLRLVTARGRARVEAGPVAQRRSLAGEELRLGFAAGEEGPALTTIHGNGNVYVVDADGTEFAGQTLDVGMKPTALLVSATQPAAPTTRPEDAFALIERLDARGNVSLKRRDGTAASGDQVQLTGDADGRRLLLLLGTPARAGGVSGTVIAERLELDPKTRDVRVPVAGRLTSGDPNDPAASTGTVDWDRSMSLDAVAGTALVEGNVRIVSADAKGSTLRAASKTATLSFAPEALDAAASRPTTGLATTRPSPAASVRAMVLRDDVDVTFESDDGRFANVQTRVLSLDIEHDLITADEPGRMRMVDRPAAATRPATLSTSGPTTPPYDELAATLPTTVAASTQPGGRRRATEFGVRWQGKMRWDLKAGRLAITDRVVVGYDRLGRGDTIRIFTDRLLGTLSPIDVREKREGDAPRIEMKAILAQGNVRVESKMAQFDAASLDYDLSSKFAHARGNAERDVQVFDSRGASRLGFSAITWNVETGAIEDFRDISGQLRR